VRIVKSLDGATADAHAVYDDVVVVWRVFEVKGDKRKHAVFLFVGVAAAVGGAGAVAVAKS
jgi:hypothetical protein